MTPRGRGDRGRSDVAPALPLRLGLVELLADDTERKIVVALQGERGAQPIQVGCRELAVTGLGARRADDALHLQEAQRAGGQLGELRRQAGEDLSDAEKPCGRGALAGGTSRRHQSFARSIGEAKKFIRNLPMRSSEPFFSSLRSTRSPST